MGHLLPRSGSEPRLLRAASGLTSIIHDCDVKLVAGGFAWDCVLQLLLTVVVNCLFAQLLMNLT